MRKDRARQRSSKNQMRMESECSPAKTAKLEPGVNTLWITVMSTTIKGGERPTIDPYVTGC